ncbi:MAG: T9SS type A sorting domain-containing protein, partial [Candidatus Cloacimonadota bacterium]|nr:T9SS type A sorting domain-containing protein [Candidatus Cloacimonadota bacterium]
TREVTFSADFETAASANQFKQVKGYAYRTDAPINRSLEGYKIYRDDAEIAEIGADATIYADEDLADATYSYYVTAVYTDGESEPSNTATAEVDNNGDASEVVVTSLNRNYPNPFNPTTAISFSIAEESKVELVIYNVKGQKVKTLANDVMEAGNHSLIWNGETDNGATVGSGMYFYKMKNGRYTSTKKMILIK